VIEVGTARLLVRVIVSPPVAPVGTVITAGDQPVVFVLAHVAVEPVTAVPQVYPHIGTVFPSGSVIVLGAAVRLMACVWAEAMPAPRRRTDAPDTAALTIALRELSRIAVLLI
jgi:hypothetical protein